MDRRGFSLEQPLCLKLLRMLSKAGHLEGVQRVLASLRKVSGAPQVHRRRHAPTTRASSLKKKVRGVLSDPVVWV